MKVFLNSGVWVGVLTFGAVLACSAGATVLTAAQVFNTPPLFNNVSPTFATLADSTFQGIEWPFTAPMTGKVRFGVRPSMFNSRLDHMIGQSYNAALDCSVRDDVFEHAFAITMEPDYHYDATEGHEQVEVNWSFVPPGLWTETWRPFQFALRVPDNNGTGAAKWWFTANNVLGGGITVTQNNVMSLEWPHVAINTRGGTDEYINVAGFSSWMRTSTFDGGGATRRGIMSRTIFDASGENYNQGISSEMDFSAPSIDTRGGAAAFDVPRPAAPGSRSKVGFYAAYRVQDQGFNNEGYTGVASAFRIDAQTTANGAQGNLDFVGGGYRNGHVVLGATHLWEDEAGRLRVDRRAPDSATDGNAVVTGTGSSSHGTVFWGVTTETDAAFDTGHEVCAASGLTCVTTFDTWGAPINCTKAHTSYDGWPAECK